MSELRHLRLAVLLLLAACSGEAGERTGVAAPRNLVVVTVDTLRADHLHAYGYFRETSPRLDRLAAEATVFERAYSTSGSTLPSHLTMFTGRLPHEHGYVSNLHALGAPFRSEEGLRTLAELLAGAGYRTAAFVSAAPIGSRTGVQAGFDVFEDPDGRASRTGVETHAKLFPWLRSFAAERGPRPLFLWVHYWDVHEPNEPREPYASMFADEPALRETIAARGVRPEVLAASFPPRILARHFAPARFAEWEGRRAEEPPRVDLEAVVDLYNRYDGDVRTVDDHLGELLALLEELDLWERTVLVFAGDHGQGLGQKDWLEHGRIFDGCVHVPLVVRVPGRAPARVDRVVSLVDLASSVAARLNLPADVLARVPRGGDLFGELAAPSPALQHRSERDRKQWQPGERVAVTTARWKLVRNVGGEEELYDLAADPSETRSVLAEEPAVAAELRARIDELLARPGRTVARPAEGEGDAALEADLNALGYGGDEER